MKEGRRVEGRGKERHKEEGKIEGEKSSALDIKVEMMEGRGWR